MAEKARLNLMVAQDQKFTKAMRQAQVEVKEVVSPTGTGLEELVEGTTLYLWATMFQKEWFLGAGWIMWAEENKVMALLRTF